MWRSLPAFSQLTRGSTRGKLTTTPRQGGEDVNVFRTVLTGAVLGLALATPSFAAPVTPQAEQTGFALVVGHGTVVNPNIPGLSYQIDAFVVRLPGGSVSGYYRHGGPGGDVVEARCVRVEAGRALVGGIIVKSSIPQQIGMGANLVVDDRGRWGAPLGDRIISGIGPATANLCPFSPAQIAGPWDDVVRGDFSVVAAPFGHLTHGAG